MNSKDPYGRGNIPVQPKAPKYFSLFKPLKLFIWGWFWMMDGTFRKAWKEMADEDFEPLVVVILLLGMFVGEAVPVLLISWLVFGLTGWWLLLACFGSLFGHLIVYFTFHLHEEEGRQHWKDRLLS